MGAQSLEDSRLATLWNQGPFEIPFYSGTMGRNRFQEILQNIRFDDTTTQQQLHDRRGNNKIN